MNTLPSDNSRSNSASFSRISSDRLDKSTSKSIVMYTFLTQKYKSQFSLYIHIKRHRIFVLFRSNFLCSFFCNTHTTYWKKLWKMLALHLKLFSVNCFITHDLFNDPLVYANWQSFSTAVDIIIQFSHLWRFTRHFCFVVHSFHHRFRGEALPASSR